MKRNMAFTVVDRLFIVVYGTTNPTDQEWQRYLDAVERHGIDRTLQLVVTLGGGPTSGQSRRLNELLAGRTVPVAVLSASLRVRMIVWLLSWFNPRIRAFSFSALRDALGYLEVPPSRIMMIQSKLAELWRVVGARE